MPRHRFICGGSHISTKVLASLDDQNPRSGHARAPPGQRAFAGQHWHASPSPYAHGAERARAGSRQLRGSVTNGITPSIALAHRAEDGSFVVRSVSVCNVAVAAVVVAAVAVAAGAGSVAVGDGDGGGASTGDGVEDDESADNVLLQLCTYVMPPTALRNAAVLAGCNWEDESFTATRVAVPVEGHDGGHAHETTLFTAHHAESGAELMRWVPCTRIV